MKLTYIDSGVLIAAFRGPDDLARRACEVLDDPGRTFASSEFVKLELLPKAAYNKSELELEFYETFFGGVSVWGEPVALVVADALKEAKAQGLAAMDALHVASASVAGAEELVSTEKAGKPIHRARSVSVTSIQP